MVLAGLIAFAAVPAAGQTDRTFWFVMAGGAGYTVADTTYAASASYTVRLGLGAHLLHRVGIETSIFKLGAIRPGGFVCANTLSCGAIFDLIGAEGGAFADVGPAEEPNRFRLGAGAGVFRVHADPETGHPLSNVAALGLRLAGEGVVDRWERGEIAFGVRGLVIPDAHAERIWLVSFELVLRFR